MKKIILTNEFTVFETITDLPATAQQLMEEAVSIRKKAYAPYSQFKVGAALLLDNGKTILGSNQENVAYPSGLCAERVAVFQAGALYPEAKILEIAITGASELHQTSNPIPPCGACRQSMIEYENKQDRAIAVYFMGEVGVIYQSKSVQNLLPFVFDKNL